MITIKKLKFKLSYTQTIALGFIALIVVGGLILCLPVSSKSGNWTSPVDALFTATSATCITGLVLHDTFTYWSVMGQLVILLLAQIGGIGFMTLVTMFAIFMKRRIGLHERLMLVQSAGTLRLSGVVRLIKRIVIVALGFELAGAVLLSVRFVPQMGIVNGIYNAVFHSVSAFCNAGFDLMGRYGQFSSFTRYAGDPLVSVTLIILIVTGSLGFIVWEDIGRHKWRFRNYELHSKLVLTVTAALIAVGWVLFYFLESANSDGTLSGLSGIDRVIAALFQSVTPRTAGIVTTDVTALSEAGGFLTIVLMLIGGSPGSTAGGIKTTTLAVLLLGAVASARRTRHVTAFKRRIEGGIVREAGAFLTVYLSVVVVATLLLCTLEPFLMEEILFEVTSAIGTVGLSSGITPALSAASKMVVMFLMFVGRVGWLTLVFALAGKYHEPPTKRVAEKVLIG